MQGPHFPWAISSLWLDIVGLLGQGHSWKRKDSLVEDFVSRTSQQPCWTSFELHCSLRWHSGRQSACQCRRCKRLGFDPWAGKIPWSRKWQPTPGFLPGKSHGQRSLAGYSPWGCKRVRHNWAYTHTHNWDASYQPHILPLSFTGVRFASWSDSSLSLPWSPMSFSFVDISSVWSSV